MVCWAAVEAHDTHVHTLMANHIISHPMWHMGLCRECHYSKGGWNRSKWVEPPQGWGWGYCLSLQSSILFLTGVSNRQLGIEEIATSWKQSHKTALFPHFYMNWEKANREQMRRPEGGFITFSVCTKQVCVRGCVCVRTHIGSRFSRHSQSC